MGIMIEFKHFDGSVYLARIWFIRRDVSAPLDSSMERTTVRTSPIVIKANEWNICTQHFEDASPSALQCCQGNLITFCFAVAHQRLRDLTHKAHVDSKADSKVLEFHMDGMQKKMDVPIHTDHIDSGGTPLEFIVDGDNAVGSFVTRSPVPWNIAVPPDCMIGVQILADVSVAFHVQQERSVVVDLPSRSLTQKSSIS